MYIKIYIDHNINMNLTIYMRIYMYLNINIKTNIGLMTNSLYIIAPFLRFKMIASLFSSV